MRVDGLCRGHDAEKPTPDMENDQPDKIVLLLASSLFIRASRYSALATDDNAKYTTSDKTCQVQKCHAEYYIYYFWIQSLVRGCGI